MALHTLIVFGLAYALAVATPGPVVTATVARVLGKGLSGMWAFIIGCVIGDLIWFVLAVAGLAVLAQTFHPFFLACRYLGAFYLLYIAYSFWTSPTQSIDTDVKVTGENPYRLFLIGISLPLGNPKAIVFFLALLPSLISLQQLTLTEAVHIGLLIIGIFSIVLIGYTFLAEYARQYFTSARAIRNLNHAASIAMVSAAVLILLR